jgi:AcrR family transcriptional regulator
MADSAGGGGGKGAVASSRRPALSPDFIQFHRRRRVVVAVAELTSEFGIGAATVGRICKLSRMSRMTFYDLFASASDCLRYSFAEAFEGLFAPVREASLGGDWWLGGLDRALEALFETAAGEPALAELCLVHCFGAAAEAEGHDYEAGVGLIAELLAGGREAGRERLGRDYCEPPALVEDYLARTIVSLAALKLKQGQGKTLPEHRAEMVMLSASAFFGAEEAGRLYRELRAE